jgi:iron complex outermembrane recepter protein
VGHSFNPEYAVVWRPIQAVSLRSSWSESFRPPPLFDLYQPLLDAAVPTVDPARNGELAFPIWRAGGNARLKPANADSFTTNLRFAPIGMSGLRVDATYWRIRVSETIGIPQVERLLSAESQFQNRVVRRDPSPADVAAGLPGPLELIDVTRLNYGSISTSGVDLRAAIDIDTRAGLFEPNLAATWVHDFRTTDLIEGPDFNRVDLADLLGSVVRWRAVAGLTWSRQGFGASGAVRYVPSYRDVDASRKDNGRKIDAQALVDLQLSVQLTEMVPEGSPWDGFELRVGVFNLFDDGPPFAEVGWLTGFDPSQGDLKQRYGYIKLTKKF